MGLLGNEKAGTHTSNSHTHTLFPRQIWNKNRSAFMLLEIVSIVPPPPWCVAICGNQWSPEIGIILSMVHSSTAHSPCVSLCPSLLVLEWEKVITRERKGLVRWRKVAVVCLLWKDLCMAVAPPHIFPPALLCPLLLRLQRYHTHITAQWAVDTMMYTASAHGKHNPHYTCAKVDSLKTMPRQLLP